ncbi:hypothetical protein [uncultured Desulfovibrio sp.]|uniref:hypothetical protein n=1 Tax=uncultured Desulfovibrio sp. TaxID=167968 RepID=UPI002621CC3F|nr:hypothetical protein [uncultured Desulfovibrio sp.]
MLNAHGTEINFTAATALMDKELREEIQCRLGPCSDEDFFFAYAAAHYETFGEVFEFAKKFHIPIDSSAHVRKGLCLCIAPEFSGRDGAI